MDKRGGAVISDPVQHDSIPTTHTKLRQPLDTGATCQLLDVRSAPESSARHVRGAAGWFVPLGLGFAVYPAFFGLSAFVGAGHSFTGIPD